MEAINLWRDLSTYLSVSHQVINQTGAEINTGEQFTIRVRVINTAPPPSCFFRRPTIIFDNVFVSVRATHYARPVAGLIISVPLNDPSLTANDGGFVDVVMEALDEIPWFPGPSAEEFIAHVEVRANLRQNAFFQICRHVHLYEDLGGGVIDSFSHDLNS